MNNSNQSGATPPTDANLESKPANEAVEQATAPADAPVAEPVADSNKPATQG